MRDNRVWTQEEIEFLLSNCSTMTIKEIAEKLGRNYDSVYGKLWFIRNHEKCLKRTAEYRKLHKGYYREYRKRWKQLHKDKEAEYKRRWRLKNPGKEAQRKREWWRKNKDRVTEIRRRYRQNHRDKVLMWQRQNWERHKDLYNMKRNIRHRLTKLQKVKQLGGKCSRCGYDKCLAALDIHNHKSSNPVLLCRNCHMELHYPQTLIDEIMKISGESELKVRENG